MVLYALLTALALLAIVFLTVIVRTAIKRGDLPASLFEAIGLGAVTNFFDTLGIGSFAPTTAWIKFRKLVPDSFIPAVLNVGHALPTVAQAAIFFVLLGVRVDPLLLTACIVAAVLGGLVGAPLVVRAPVRLVQGIVGVALLIAASLYAMSNLNWFPIGGDATALTGPFLYVAVGMHFLLGVLMSFGIGLYAPSLIMLSLMGLDPKLAFPIMAGACAFLMPTTGFRFAASERIDLKVVMGLALGGVPAVLLAAFVVKDLDVVVLRWLVVAVVLYASTLLLRSAFAVEKAVPAAGKLGIVMRHFITFNKFASPALTLIIFWLGVVGIGFWIYSGSMDIYGSMFGGLIKVTHMEGFELGDGRRMGGGTLIENEPVAYLALWATGIAAILVWRAICEVLGQALDRGSRT